MPRGGRSAKNPQIANPQICELIFYISKTFATVANLLICALWTIHFLRFADLRFANPRTTLGFWDSFELHGLRTVGKNSTGSGSGSETLPLSLQICVFAICGLGHQGNYQIRDLRIIHYKCIAPVV
jgi:hypothetical protein